MKNFPQKKMSFRLNPKPYNPKPPFVRPPTEKTEKTEKNQKKLLKLKTVLSMSVRKSYLGSLLPNTLLSIIFSFLKIGLNYYLILDNFKFLSLFKINLETYVLLF